MFALIEYVLAVDVENYFFIVHVLHTTCFNPHFHACEVEYPGLREFTVVKLTDLVDHHPLGLYTCKVLDQSLHLVSLKYHVISN